MINNAVVAGTASIYTTNNSEEQTENTSPINAAPSTLAAITLVTQTVDTLLQQQTNLDVEQKEKLSVSTNCAAVSN